MIDVAQEIQEVIVEIKQFGINQLGYQSLSSMMSMPGIKFHHINLDEDQPYMGGAGIKRQMRQAAQFGAKFTTNDEFEELIRHTLMNC